MNPWRNSSAPRFARAMLRADSSLVGVERVDYPLHGDIAPKDPMRMMSAPGWGTFGRRILDKTFSCTLGPRIGVFRSVAMVLAATWNQRKSATPTRCPGCRCG